MTSCREQAISHAAAAYADFLHHGPHANPDPFFLPNVFANDTDEVYPVANWWLCGSPFHSVGQQDGSLPKSRNYGAAGPTEPPVQHGSLPKPLNCVASSCTSSTRTSSGGSPSYSPGRQDGSLPKPLSYGAAGPSELNRVRCGSPSDTNSVGTSCSGSPCLTPGRQDGSLCTPLNYNYGAAGPSELHDLRCTTPTMAPSITSTDGRRAPSITSTDGRRRRSRRPGSTTSSLSTATVGGSIHTTPACRLTGGVGNGPVGGAGSDREQGEHSFRRGSGRSLSTPRIRTVSENVTENGDGVEEAPARRGSEDDGALVRMKEHQELKNLLRAYQSSFLTSHGRCAPLVAAPVAARVKGGGGGGIASSMPKRGPAPGLGRCGPTPHELWLCWPSVSLHLAPSRRIPSRRTQATAVRPRLEAGLGAVPALPDVANGALRRPRRRVERW